MVILDEICIYVPYQLTEGITFQKLHFDVHEKFED